MVGHAVILRGTDLPGLSTVSDGPTVLSVIEQDFLDWFLSRMETPEGREELGARDAFARVNGDGHARFFQPVHKTFNIVVLEVACDVEGRPRLDPGKILGAGMTLRRVVTPEEAAAAGPGDTFATYAPGTYGWMKVGARTHGWSRIAGGTERLAPDVSPEFRALAAQGRNAKVLRQARGPDTDAAEASESFAPLFKAPDELCRRLKKTILYGYLPVTSGERSETAGPPEAPFGAAEIGARLPSLLWGTTRAKDRDPEPLKNQTVDAADAADPSDRLEVILAALRYLGQEAGLFLEEEATEALRGLLAGKSVRDRANSRTTDFYSFLKAANRSLIERDPARTRQWLPARWPDFTDAEEARITDALTRAVQARWAVLSPGETRYQNMDARYELQAFVRVDRSDCGCPPQTVWSTPRQKIEIVPWYEGGEAPPTLVELPAPGALRGKVSPNVAFKVPEEIQKFMSGLKLDKLMEGEQPSEKWGFGMICGFSIPIITICAFIVLQIFLSLFHILFWWLPFIRICIPFPKKEG